MGSARELLVDPLLDLFEGSARAEDVCDAGSLELGNVRVRDDSAAEYDDVLGSLSSEFIDHAGKQRQVCTGQRRQTDAVDVLLNRDRGDLGWRLVKPGIDDFTSGVTKSAGDNFRPAVVSVETRFCDEDPDRHRPE